MLAGGAHAPADVVGVDRAGLVKFWFTHNGADVEISGSPYDPTGTKPDSWHWAEAD